MRELKATSKEAYKLFHEGTLALSQVEANGICIDMEYLENTIKKSERKIKHLTEKLEQDKILKVWKKTYKNKFSLDSHTQLGNILFDKLGYECKKTTEKGNHKTDSSTLMSLDIPFVSDYLQIQKLKKGVNTYLKNIKKYTDSNNFLHPSFNLNTVSTFRSSSSDPNFQNMPIRNPEIGKLIRKCFIPRASNRHFVEIDYSGVEVSIAACYHKDANMLSYIKDKTKDMHRDMGGQCFMVEPDKVSKNIRYCGKNMFVFPQFYGDWWKSCSKSLWEAIDNLELETTDGMSVKQLLKQKGITELGNCKNGEEPANNTFEKHIKDVENDFWNNRFADYGKWKKDFYEEYLTNGYFDSHTGFRFRGSYNRKEVGNYPVQGAAFHCLLWSLIRLQKLLKKYKFKSVLIGQIHDSISADVLDSELNDFLDLAQKVMTEDIMKYWKWIIVPLEVEADVADKGLSWFDKKAWRKDKITGIWQVAKKN